MLVRQAEAAYDEGEILRKRKGPCLSVQADTRKEAVLEILAQCYGDTASALVFANPFQLLIAVMLAAQTNDQQVNKVTGKLFAAYPDAAHLALAEPEEIEPYISTCGLYKNKAKNIVATCRMLVADYGGEVPADKAQLLRLPGVGGKTANVVLSVGFGIPALAVDTHVFRVANRLGLAQGKTPEAVEEQLTAWIPQEKWSAAHHWLIWHGRRICTARHPKCDQCPLAALCPSQAPAS